MKNKKRKKNEDLQLKKSKKKKRFIIFKSLEIFAPIFEFFQSVKLVPEKFYKNLPALSVKQKIQIIIINTSFPILVILLLVFIFLAITIFRNIQIDKETRNISVKNSWEYLYNRLQMYGNIVSEHHTVLTELISITPNAHRIHQAVTPLLKKLGVSEITIYNKSGIVLVRAHDIVNFGQNEIESLHIKGALKQKKSSYIITETSGKKNHMVLYTTPIYYEKEIIGAASVGYYFDHYLAKKIYKSSGTHVFFSLNELVLATSYGKIKNKSVKFSSNSLWLRMNLIGLDKTVRRFFLDYKKITLPLKDNKGRDVNLGLTLTIDNFITKITLFSTLIISLLLAVAAVIFSINIAANIASGISLATNTISKGIDGFSEGNYKQRIKLDSDDELGHIAAHFNVMADKLEDSYQTIAEAKTQLIQAEKMSTLGQMVAGVVHEINNPINYISGAGTNLKTDLENFENFLKEIVGDEPEAQELAKEFENKFSQMFQNVKDISQGVARVTEINQAMRNYSRMDPDFQNDISLEKIIDESLIILSSRVKRHNVEKNYNNLPRLTCHPSHLGQVFTNLIANASDAINQKIEQLKEKNTEHHGIIRIIAKPQDENGVNGVAILIEDNGPGVPKEIREKILDAFFTTKERGKGTGLGLAITANIITNHKGKLEILSSEDLKGAFFKVWLPLHIDKD
jgi:signal transduction histidine kinase